MVDRQNEGQLQSLAKGLDILRLVTRAEGPLTATELAKWTQMHQSSASRMLQTLTSLGYVLKTPAGFVPHYGVISFAHAVDRFPLVAQLQGVVQQIADDHPDYMVNLAMLFQGDMTYLLRATAQQRPVTLWGFPLHVSSAALRILVDLPEDEALALLHASRSRSGWEQTEHVPDTEAEVLGWARQHVEHDVLVLNGWSQDSISGAIPIKTGEEHPVVLAIAGSPPTASPTEVAFMLHDARRKVEALAPF